MRIKSNGGTVTIGGQTFSGDVCVGEGGTITVNGAVVGKQASQEISVVVTGYVERLELGAGSVTVSGNADSIETMSGAVYCQDVGLHIETMSGSINCRDVGGSVSTMSGSIKHRAPGSDIDSAALQRKINDISLALAFALANGDHAGTRADVKMAQAHLEDLRQMVAGGAA